MNSMRVDSDAVVDTSMCYEEWTQCSPFQLWGSGRSPASGFPAIGGGILNRRMFTPVTPVEPEVSQGSKQGTSTCGTQRLTVTHFPAKQPREYRL